MSGYLTLAGQRHDRLQRNKSLRERMAKRNDRRDGWVCVQTRTARKAALNHAWNAMAQRNAKGIYVEFRIVRVKDFLFSSGHAYEAQIREVR